MNKIKDFTLKLSVFEGIVQHEKEKLRKDFSLLNVSLDFSKYDQELDDVMWNVIFPFLRDSSLENFSRVIGFVKNRMDKIMTIENSDLVNTICFFDVAHIVVQCLKEYYSDKDILDYYIYEVNFGRDAYDEQWDKITVKEIYEMLKQS